MSVKLKISIDTNDVEMVTDISDVHYRIIWSKAKEAGVVVCVQDFDYFDYSEFIGDECFAREDDAEDALVLMNRAGIELFRNRPTEDTGFWWNK